MDRIAPPTSLTIGNYVSLFELVTLMLAIGVLGALLWLMLQHELVPVSPGRRTGWG